VVLVFGAWLVDETGEMPSMLGFSSRDMVVAPRG
jgi:hypothetical protein